MGHFILAVDYSKLELKVMMYLSGDEAFVQVKAVLKEGISKIDQIQLNAEVQFFLLNLPLVVSGLCYAGIPFIL